MESQICTAHPSLAGDLCLDRAPATQRNAHQSVLPSRIAHNLGSDSWGPLMAGLKQRHQQFARRKPVVEQGQRDVGYSNWMARSTDCSWPSAHARTAAVSDRRTRAMGARSDRCGVFWALALIPTLPLQASTTALQIPINAAPQKARLASM